jgi:hypothetical protein
MFCEYLLVIYNVYIKCTEHKILKQSHITSNKTLDSLNVVSQYSGSNST